MRRFLYPCVIYYDKDNQNYAVAFHDLGIFTEADSVEKAYIRAKLFLEAYCEAGVKMEEDFPIPTSFEALRQKHPKDIVQLVFAEVGEVAVNLENKTLDELLDDEDIEEIEGEITPGPPFNLMQVQ